MNRPAETQMPRRCHLNAGLGQVALGGVLMYALCVVGPGVIDHITATISTVWLLTVVVAVGIAVADVGSIMLILSGLSHLRKALSMRAASAAVVVDQPPAQRKEQQ